MLYTASITAINKVGTKMKMYQLKENQGNDAVAPDHGDVLRCEAKILTWKGVKSNYLTKLMREEAIEWMRHVSEEAASQDIVLVDEEANVEESFRRLLAEIMVSMFSSTLRFGYAGELTC